MFPYHREGRVVIGRDSPIYLTLDSVPPFCALLESSSPPHEVPILNFHLKVRTLEIREVQIFFFLLI